MLCLVVAGASEVLVSLKSESMGKILSNGALIILKLFFPKPPEKLVNLKKKYFRIRRTELALAAFPTAPIGNGCRKKTHP